MKFLKLEDIKAQCRIEPDFTDEDKLLDKFGAAVENTLLRTVDRTYDGLLEAFGEEDGDGGKTVPSDFYVAALMLVKHIYEHRGPTEMVTQSMVPYTLDLLIKPFMRLTTGEEGSV
jgi:hypothetical protein